MLNKENSDRKVKLKEAKYLIKKEHRAEVKSWRVELGQKEHLEKKSAKAGAATPAPTLSNIAPLVLQSESSSLPPSFNETICSICASPIPNYVPNYFLVGKLNPACDTCDDSFEFDDDLANEDFGDGDMSIDVIYESMTQNKVFREAVVKVLSVNLQRS